MTSVGAELDSSTFAHQIETGLQQDEFELYYQSIIHIADASIYGVEALIRWNHPGSGLLNPAEFIPFAEQTDLIVPLGAWALRRACTDFRQIRLANSALELVLILSVNVSSRQLEEPSFIADLADILEQTGTPPNLLQLEITESIFLRDAMRVGALFQAIRALGVRIAFDDFGTGYSSLSYLERYPVDVLKIDQCFVQGMSKSRVNAEIVHSIVHLAHNIGMKVCAEGVETQEQAATLLGFDCKIGQGYLYSTPVPLNAMVAILQQLPVEPTVCRRKGIPPRASAGWSPLMHRYATG